VATQIPKFSTAEIDQIEELLAGGKKAEALEMINKQLQLRAQDAIRHERAVVDKQVFRKTAEAQARDVIKEIGKIDPRLALESDDWDDIIAKPSHKLHAKYNETIGDLLKFCASSGITLEQIKTFGPKKVYALYATEKGWDKERDRKIAETEKKSLLDKLRKPSTARTLNAGKTFVESPEGDASQGFSRDQLIDNISKGNLTEWERLLEHYSGDGNVKMVTMLGAIREAGERKAMENQK
jgi:hypothetical protein